MFSKQNCSKHAAGNSRVAFFPKPVKTLPDRTESSTRSTIVSACGQGESLRNGLVPPGV
jgi:hypothetical protein